MRNQLAESGHECVKLLLDTLGNSILHNAVDVFLLVVFCDGDLLTARLEFDRDHLTKSLFSGRERLIDDVSDIIFTVQVVVVSLRTITYKE